MAIVEVPSDMKKKRVTGVREWSLLKISFDHTLFKFKGNALLEIKICPSSDGKE